MQISEANTRIVVLVDLFFVLLRLALASVRCILCILIAYCDTIEPRARKYSAIFNKKAYRHSFHAAEMSDITGSNSGRRGRARSHSVTSDELTADIDVLNGDEPSQSTHEPPAASTSPTGADSRQPTVSAKTAKILTLAGASKKREPESSLTLEEQEEQRLAEEEKLRLALKQVDLAEAETAKPKKPKGVDRQPDMTIKLLLLGDGGTFSGLR